METAYKYKLNRLLQLPLNSIQFSKNLIEVTAQWDTIDEVQNDLDTMFTKQMAQLKTSLEELKASEEIAQALKALEFVKYLQTKSPLAQAVMKEKAIFFNI